MYGSISLFLIYNFLRSSAFVKQFLVLLEVDCLCFS